MHFRSTSVVN